jgi:hypothetical protein
MLKICKQCNANFEVSDEDIKSLEKFSSVYNGKKYNLPIPDNCPDCRRQRRHTFRNERCFYKNKCGLCGQELISIYSEDSGYKVYCYKCWCGDKWDPIQYGQNFDFNNTFFKQFQDLEKKVPHMALMQDDTLENCEFVNYGGYNKSCYLSVGAFLEDVYYSASITKCRSCVDCLKCIDCELCYECVDCNNCYNLHFSQDCNNCSDSFFLKDCRQCSNCFCSSCLKNGSYVFKNEQLPKEEYFKRINEIVLTWESINNFTKIRDELAFKIPKKYIHGENIENVSGDYLDNCAYLKECFDCFNLEKSIYCDFCAFQSNDLYDSTNSGLGSVLGYQVNGGISLNNCKFIYYGRNMNDCEYSQYALSTAYIFGCVGLTHKQYCILNKQYSKDEYFDLLPKIIEHMIKTKEYGQFFLSSPFKYNETFAYEFSPLTKEEALSRGYEWKEEKKEISSVAAKEILSCGQCGKNYRTITRELNFYKKKDLPIPKNCFNCRHKKRMALRNPRHLWKRNCMKCGKEMMTTYAPERPEIVYCEECYLKEVY